MTEEKRHPKKQRVDNELAAEECKAPKDDIWSLKSFTEANPWVRLFIFLSYRRLLLEVIIPFSFSIIFLVLVVLLDPYMIITHINSNLARFGNE